MRRLYWSEKDKSYRIDHACGTGMTTVLVTTTVSLNRDIAGEEQPTLVSSIYAGEPFDVPQVDPALGAAVDRKTFRSVGANNIYIAT